MLMAARCWHIARSRLGRGAWPVLLVTCMLAGCGTSPTRPRLPPSPPTPDTYALSPYLYPVWLDGGALIGFCHRPLQSVSYDSTSGHVAYDWVDSLSGWWVVRPDGTGLRRVLGTYLREAALSPTNDRLVFTRPSATLGIAPMVGGLPDSAGIAELPTPGLAAEARWSPAGDSLVFFGMSAPLGTWVMSPAGTGARLVCEAMNYPDWHPFRSKLVGTLPTSGYQYLVEYDLVSGTLDTLLIDARYSFIGARYSPAGTMLAVLRVPVQELAPWVLCIVDSTGTIVRQTADVGYGFAWAPCGAEIVFLHYNASDYTMANGTLWILDVATGATRRLTANP